MTSSMWRSTGLAVWVAATSAAGSSCDAFDNACNRAVRDYCAHQVECGIHFDQLLCEEESHAVLYCNPTTSTDKFERCTTDLEFLDCANALPASCSEILCDRLQGCEYDSCTDTTLTPDGEPRCVSDDGGPNTSTP